MGPEKGKEAVVFDKKDVLVATDLGPAGDEAIVQGAAWADKLGGKLCVMHVVPNPIRNNPLFPQLNQSNLEALLELENRAAEALAERTDKLIGRREDVEFIVDNGMPGAVVVSRAQDLGVGLVVVGVPGGGLEQILIGSQGDRVLRFAGCAVLVARKTKAGAGDRVLAATDFSDPRLPVLRTGAALAKAFDRNVAFLHVLDVLPASMGRSTKGVHFGGETVLPKEAIAEARGHAQDTMHKLVREIGTDAVCVVSEGASVDIIVEEAKTTGAGLIVIGTHGRTGLARMSLGSVAEDVVRRAPCPVLVLRLD